MKRCVSSSTTEGGVIEALFTDNQLMNGSGTDLVVFETVLVHWRVWPTGERFGVSVPLDGGFSQFRYFEPPAWRVEQVNDATSIWAVFAVEIDLSDFGLPEGALIDRVRLHVFDLGMGYGSAEIATLGALHSAPQALACPVIQPDPEPTVMLDRVMLGDVRRVKVRTPGYHKKKVCVGGDHDDDDGRKCRRMKVHHDGATHYSFSAAEHGLQEIHFGSLLVTARDLDLHPDLRVWGRRDHKWKSIMETLSLSAGGHELAFLDADFALDHGVTDTDDVVVNFEIVLDEAGLEALAAADYQIDVTIQATYDDYRGRHNRYKKTHELVSVVFVAEGL
jgi:hypothetical protein